MKKVKNALLYVYAIVKAIIIRKKNKHKLSFVKDSGVWYVDLPNWTLARSHLAMVAGADKLLDEMSDNGDKITLLVSNANKYSSFSENDIFIKLIEKDFGGVSGTFDVISTYKTKQLWLCPVVSFVFGQLPKYLIINNI